MVLERLVFFGYILKGDQISDWKDFIPSPLHERKV